MYCITMYCIKMYCTVSDEVDPEQLDGDEGFREAEGRGQEDCDDLTNVGGNQVSGIDSFSFLSYKYTTLIVSVSDPDPVGSVS